MTPREPRAPEDAPPPRAAALRAFLARNAQRILLVTGLAAIAFHWLTVWVAPPASVDVRPFLPLAAPDARAFSDREGTPPRWTALTPGPGGVRLPLGSIVSSADLAPAPRGYAGPVPLLVGVAPEGTITGVALLPNHETPAYAARVGEGGFLRQFTGRRVGDRLVLGEDLDGVTRATVTATAVAEGVRSAARSAAREIYGLPLPPEAPLPRPLPWLPLAAVAGVVLLGLLAALSGSRVLGWVALAASLAGLGFWQSTWISSAHLAAAFLGRWPPLLAQLPWYLLFAVAIGAALLWRNVYCERLCPFGALQELLHTLSLWRLPAAPEDELGARALRVWFLWLATLAVFVFGATEAAGFEPFATVFDFADGLPRRALLAAVLVLALARLRPWCRYFCPTGTCLQLLARPRKSPPPLAASR